jgi:hypothetical protein
LWARTAGLHDGIGSSSGHYPDHPLAKVAPLYGGENRRHKENIAYRLKLHRKKPLKEREKIREEAFSDRYAPAPKKRETTCFYFYDTHPINSPKAKYGKSEVGEIVGGLETPARAGEGVGRKLGEESLAWMLKDPKPPKPFRHFEWDKMVGLGGVWWTGPTRPELPTYTTLEDLFYWHPLNHDHEDGEPHWVWIGGDERQGGLTVWHVPDCVLKNPGAAKAAIKEARALRRARSVAGKQPKRWTWRGASGVSPEDVRGVRWLERKQYYKRVKPEGRGAKKPVKVRHDILPLRNVPGSRNVVVKEVDPDARQLIFKDDHSAVARAVDPAEIERAHLEWFRKIDAQGKARRKYDAEVAELTYDSGKCLEVIERRLAKPEKPWTYEERSGAAEFLVDRIIRLRRINGVPRNEVGYGLTEITLGRLERAVELGESVAPQVNTIRKLALAADALLKMRLHPKERRELTDEEKAKRHEAYPHPADAIERALQTRRRPLYAALTKLNLYGEGYHIVGEKEKCRTFVRRSGVLWDGLKESRAIPSRERGEHVGDAYYALIKEYDKDPDAVPVWDPEALTHWVRRTVRKTGGLTHGRYGDGVQVTSATKTERSRRSKSVPTESTARYLDEALSKAMEGADFELADDGDPVHEMLAGQEIWDRLRGGEPDFEVLMLAAPPTYRKPQGGVLPGYHYVKDDGTVHTLGDLYMYDAKRDRKALELGTVEEWLAALGIHHDGTVTYLKPPGERMIHSVA